MTSIQPDIQPELANASISRWGALPSFLDRYSLDVRSLALLRIGLALLLLTNLFVWSGSITGQPILRGFLSLAAAIAAVAMLFGDHSRLAAIASWLLLAVLHNGHPLLIAVPIDMLKITLCWAIFLPLGAAYSVDRAMNTAPQPVPLQILSGATLALMAQPCFIYIFWALSSPTKDLWLQGIDPTLRPFALPLLALECLGPLLLWSPFRNGACRIVAVAVFVILHLGLALIGLVLTTNMGMLPFLMAVVWLAFIPTLGWEKLGSSVYGSKEPGLRRTSLKIYYDADCGFCKKVVHLIRMLLVLPHTPIATAQSIPAINEAMEVQNSWVIVDWKGQHHYKFEGIAYVVSLSPVFGPLASVLRWHPVMAIGTRFYEWIATNRKIAGRFTKPFKFKPLTVKNPGWLSAVALLLLVLTFALNLHSAVVYGGFL